MRWTKLEICNTIARTWGLTYNTLSPDEKVAMDVNINSIIEDICVNGKIPMLKKWGIINAVAQYNTGTVTIATANGVSTVTGLGTTWTADMIGRKIIFTGFGLAYTIASVSAVGTLTLEEIFINTTDNSNTLSTANAYTIVKDIYKLAPDFASFAEREVFDLTGGVQLEVKDSVDFDREQPNRTVTQSPNQICLRGLSDDNYYNTGTVLVTGGSASIVGTNTAWTAQMNGMPFRVVGDSAEYIFTYLSATTGSLDRVYEGTTALTATYGIEFPGLLQAQIDPKPITPRLIKYAYYRMLPKLVNDSDVLQLPIQNAVISGGTYKMALTKESDKSTKIDQFYKLYTRDLELLRNAGRVPAQQKGMRPGVA